jgi:hypothetical protein
MRDKPLIAILAIFVVLACVFGSLPLDIDEFRVIKEPYEMIGGDYTMAYLRAGEWARALDCIARSYALYWKYRPLSSPLIEPRDQARFREEERRFGYVKPGPTTAQSLDVYRHRLIVPEPDRFYRHGAGAPLLSAILRIPALALTRLVTLRGPDLLDHQFRGRLHPVFIAPRLQGIVAGMICIVLVFVFLRRETSREQALLGAALLGAVPPALLYFPNLHYDAILAPLVLAASYAFVRDRHGIGGVFFGLAMAAKNTAVIVAPAAGLFVIAEAVRRARAEGRASARSYLTRKAAGLAWFCLVGVVALAPFAHPVSQLREILTPVVSRPIDPRGEDPARYTMLGTARAGARADSTAVQATTVSRIRTGVGYNLSLLFVLLGMPLVWSRLSSPWGRFGFWLLLLSFPLRLVMGDGLSYRSLVFLPFFATIAALVLDRRALVGLIVILVILDLMFLLDPISATGIPRVVAAAAR